MKNRITINIQDGSFTLSAFGTQYTESATRDFYQGEILDLEVVLMNGGVDVTTSVLTGSQLYLGMGYGSQILTESEAQPVEGGASNCVLNISTPEVHAFVSGWLAGAAFREVSFAANVGSDEAGTWQTIMQTPVRLIRSSLLDRMATPTPAAT